MELIIGILFIILGGWAFADSKGFLDMKVRWAKMFGIKMVLSKKTYQMYRYVGIAGILAGLYLILG